MSFSCCNIETGTVDESVEGNSVSRRSITYQIAENAFRRKIDYKFLLPPISIRSNFLDLRIFRRISSRRISVPFCLTEAETY